LNENVNLNSVCWLLQDSLLTTVKTERNEKVTQFELGRFLDEILRQIGSVVLCPAVCTGL